MDFSTANAINGTHFQVRRRNILQVTPLRPEAGGGNGIQYTKKDRRSGGPFFKAKRVSNLSFDQVLVR